MSQKAVESQGTELQVGNGASPEVFAKLGDLRSISGPDGSASEIVVTDLDSTAVEIKMGLPDEGQVTLGLGYDPVHAQQETLRTQRAARALTNFKMVLPDSKATTFAFAAYVLTFSLETAVDDVVLLNVTLRVTGPVTRSQT